MPRIGRPLRALDLKALRDLQALRGQALSIALVVASGVAAFLAPQSAVSSLARARDAFYDTGVFADLFAQVRRAPLTVLAQVRALPGVLEAQGRVEATARITVAGSAQPVIGQLIGLDPLAPPGLNRVQLRQGRWPQPDPASSSRLEAVASEGFMRAHRLPLGAEVDALVQGRLRSLRLVGVGLTPEYIFGGLLGSPDPRAFGVFWVDARQLAGDIDMAGAFNHLAIKRAPGTDEIQVLVPLTRLLAPYGGAPPHGRGEQASHQMLDNEITEQRVMGTVLPAIFLAVASFLLHMVVARLVATQREQLATLMALGYHRRELAAHYLKLVAPMVLAGCLLGWGLGHALGRGLMGLYAEFFRFPSLDLKVTPALTAAAWVTAIAAALTGTGLALRSAVALSPAQAMQPPAPGPYRRTWVESWTALRLSPGSRMVLRHLGRRPWRAGLSLVGMALAVAIVVMGNFFHDAVDAIVDTQFNRVLRGDIVVWTTDPVAASARLALVRLPGVTRVEAARRVSVQFTHGAASARGSIEGRELGDQLQRVIDADQRVVPLEPSGLVMNERLARQLGLRPGDWVQVEVREGRRGVHTVRLVRTVGEMFGLYAYMERGALNRLLGEGDQANAFVLALDAGQVDAALVATQTLPRVAGAFSKAHMLQNMQAVSARNVRIMSTVLTLFAAVIAVGVVYNSARIALAERTWELASLRVLGFTRGEVSTLLLGELALLLAGALPVGMALGWALTHLLVDQVASDQFQFPVVIQARTYAGAALVVALAALFSALWVRRRVDRLDLIAVLKTRE